MRHLLRTSRRLRFALTLIVAGGIGAPSLAEVPTGQLPPELQGVGINERLDEMLPLDLQFTDQDGNLVTLGDYFKQGKPVIITPVFYECPMLCSLILNGLVDGLNGLEEWSAGDQFEIVTFSFNPDEKPKLAEVKRRAYLTQYRREATKQGWPFLTGSQENIKLLTDALGYSYRYDERQEVYIHSASIMFITPDGRISRYMNDVLFQPRDLRLALVEASEGKIGSPMEQFLLFTCFRYDPDSNSYVADAWKVMRLGGVVTIIAFVIGFILLQRCGSKPDLKKETIAPGGLPS